MKISHSSINKVVGIVQLAINTEPYCDLPKYNEDIPIMITINDSTSGF